MKKALAVLALILAVVLFPAVIGVCALVVTGENFWKVYLVVLSLILCSFALFVFVTLIQWVIEKIND